MEEANKHLCQLLVASQRHSLCFNMVSNMCTALAKLVTPTNLIDYIALKLLCIFLLNQQISQINMESQFEEFASYRNQIRADSADLS